MITTSSRIRGSLHGVAVVDALGGPVEFRRRSSFPPVTKFRYNSNFDLAPGTWTDDTSMTLCLAQSVVEKEGRFDALDQVKKYVKWWDAGYMSATGSCFDIGNTTRQTLGIWEKCIKDGDAGKKRVESYQDVINKNLGHEMSCSNGSLMRCAPIPLIYHRSPSLAQQYAALASKPTHPHPTCLEACQIYTYLITNILSNLGIEKTGLWDSFKRFEFAAKHKDGSTAIPSALCDLFSKYPTLFSFQQKREDEIKSSGYVVHTLEAALWVFWTTETFREGALKVVNLGDDADTVGSVYGGMAGAWYGIESIPEEWIDGLQAKRMVDEVVDGVVKLVEEGGYGAESSRNDLLFTPVDSPVSEKK